MDEHCVRVKWGLWAMNTSSWEQYVIPTEREGEFWGSVKLEQSGDTVGGCDGVVWQLLWRSFLSWVCDKLLLSGSSLGLECLMDLLPALLMDSSRLLILSPWGRGVSWWHAPGSSNLLETCPHAALSVQWSSTIHIHIRGIAHDEQFLVLYQRRIGGVFSGDGGWDRQAQKIAIWLGWGYLYISRILVRIVREQTDKERNAFDEM